MNESTEFVLDFSLPQGPTGPTGPNPPICYIDYNTSNNINKLSIKNSKIFNSNEDFSVNGNALTIKSGTYEITFCCKIEASGTFQYYVMVSLLESLGGGYNQPIDGMTMVMPQGTECMHFSETRIIDFNDEEDIVVIITNNNPISVTISMVSLILKKILVN